MKSIEVNNRCVRVRFLDWLSKKLLNLLVTVKKIMAYVWDRKEKIQPIRVE